LDGLEQQEEVRGKALLQLHHPVHGPPALKINALCPMPAACLRDAWRICDEQNLCRAMR
jgi:hypothetical protein